MSRMMLVGCSYGATADGAQRTTYNHVSILAQNGHRTTWRMAIPGTLESLSRENLLIVGTRSRNGLARLLHGDMLARLIVFMVVRATKGMSEAQSISKASGLLLIGTPAAESQRSPSM
jgi:hypothetical protein